MLDGSINLDDVIANIDVFLASPLLTFPKPVDDCEDTKS